MESYCLQLQNLQIELFFVRDRRKILLMVLIKFYWIICLLYPLKSLENLQFSEGFRGRLEVNWFA